MCSSVGVVTTLCRVGGDQTSSAVEMERTFYGVVRAATRFSEGPIVTPCSAPQGATPNSPGAVGRTSSTGVGVAMPCLVGEEETHCEAVGELTQHSGDTAMTKFGEDEVPTHP